jgi:hypothetical protein
VGIAVSLAPLIRFGVVGRRRKWHVCASDGKTALCGWDGEGWTPVTLAAEHRAGVSNVEICARCRRKEQ